MPKLPPPVPPDRAPPKASAASKAVLVLVFIPLIAALLWVGLMLIVYLRNEPWGPN